MSKPNNIAYYRMKAKLTQAEFANTIFVEQHTLANWELGHSEPRISDCIRIAKFLNCTLDDLFCCKINEKEFYNLKCEFYSDHHPNGYGGGRSKKGESNC